ncbi:hypothetical protein ACLG6S_05255 [Thermodesulfobacteriota bacterium B35]
MTKVVSILAAGHSGSTLLDILTGTIPGVFSTGESVYFPWQLHRNGKVCDLGQDICSCGERFSNCKIWRAVVSKISKKAGYDLFDNPFRFKMAMYKNQMYGHQVSMSTRIVRALFLRSLKYCPSSPLLKVFVFPVCASLKNNWIFFDTICQTTGATHVVDSSKDIVRMALLQQSRPGDIFTVVLIRDIEGVAASAAKREQDPLLEAQRWLKLYQQYMHIIKRQKDFQVKVVRYETMVEEPDKTREQLAQYLGLVLPPSVPLAINTKAHHLVAGNPMRYKGRIHIQYDDSWKKVLTKETKKQIYALKHKYESILDGLESLAWERS